MEYIGLIGLIGLIGAFSTKRFTNKLSKMRNDMSRNEENIADLEKQVEHQTELLIDYQKEMDRLNFVLKNYTTIGELSNFSRQMKREIFQEIEKNFNFKMNAEDTTKNFEERLTALESDKNNFADSVKIFEDRLTALEHDKNNWHEKFSQVAQINFDDLAKVLDKRLSALESDRKKLLDRILTQGRAISQFEQNFNTGKNSSDSAILLEERISALENDKKILLDKIAKQEVLIIQYQTSFKDLQKTFDEQIIAYEERLRHIESLRESEKNYSVTSPNKMLMIQNFQLENIVGPLFTNKPEDMANIYHTIENVWGILSFLENSDFERKEVFIRVIKNYQQNLQKFTDKVRHGKFDGDSFSEKATNAFFDTLSKYFLATLPISIYRGSQDNFEFYSAFLVKVNEYLANCHVYTELIEPKKLIKNDTLEKMQITKKETALKSEDEMIDEVERLPYFLDYFTNEDDEESFCFEGKLILLKFKGNKK